MERTYWSYSEEKSSVITAFVCLQMSASDIYFPSNNPCLPMLASQLSRSCTSVFCKKDECPTSSAMPDEATVAS